MELMGKVALVTGGTMGIGAAVVKDLAQRGADIAVAARNDGPEAQSVRQWVTDLGRKFTLVTADLRQSEDCQRVIEETIENLGRVDVLIHNAGGPSPGTVDEITPEQWLDTIDLHINANFFLIRAALPHMRRQSEGAIVTVGSTAGTLGVPGAIAYATAKGAMPQFTRSMARDLADDNIRVNCVAPGVIRTRFHDDMTPERKKLNLDHRIPLHREGTSEQVAEVVALLVTNDYMTGETVVIDGGLTSRIA